MRSRTEVSLAVEAYLNELEKISAVRFEIARREIEAWKQLCNALSMDLPEKYQCQLNGMLRRDV